MTGKCELCEAADAPLASSFKGRALGSQLCFCCQLKVFNLMEKRHWPDADPVIAYRFECMAEVSRARREQRDSATVPVRGHVTSQPLAVRRVRGASWAAHSCPDER